MNSGQAWSPAVLMPAVIHHTPFVLGVCAVERMPVVLFLTAKNKVRCKRIVVVVATAAAVVAVVVVIVIA